MDIRRRAQIGAIKKASSEVDIGSYTVNLNSQWETTTAVPNPDSTLYDGVYMSSSNWNVDNGVSLMFISIQDCSSFRMYIRSNAESINDYVMVSQLDMFITGNADYNNTSYVKAHTRGNQQSGTELSNYTLVEFTGIPSGNHMITVVYRKDSSVNSGDDRGYVLIEKMQTDSGDSGSGEEDIIPEPIININNYLTIEALEDGLTASLSVNACEYCIDGDGNWKTLSASAATESINSGHTLSFKGNLIPDSSNGIGTFTISKKCNLKGKCMSMLFGDNAANNYSLSGKNYAFYKLFSKCTNIVNVSETFLYATTLASQCYTSMFSGCKSLTSAPKLPATTLASDCYKSMFDNCTSLVNAPKLPATTLANYCYSYMFRGTNLKTAPELPATTLADYCYGDMFRDCVSLVNAPKLPATTLANYCYSYMFISCEKLTTAPELPATTLARGCYRYMFHGTSLTTAPKLPATTLANYCYASMFSYCKNLTTAPKLPATTLAGGCYDSMFDSCTGLTTAPELPATTLTDACYDGMFINCSNLNYIKMLATSASGGLRYWVSGVASRGTFVKHPDMTSLPTGVNGIPSGWTVVNDVNIDNYLTIEALEDGLTASLSTNTCEYCVDGDGNWKTLVASTATESINSGQTLSFRGNLTPDSINGIGRFTINRKCNLKGNCMSMLFGDNAANNYSLRGKDYVFANLFYNCSNIVNVSSNFLPATTLSTCCYESMFRGCTGLTKAPALPATISEQYCYESMFRGCTSLTTAPELPATVLEPGCYEYMFYDCSKLNYVKMLAINMSRADCLYDWLYNVAYNGTFVKHPIMTSLPSGDDGIPSGWIVNDEEEAIGNFITFTIGDNTQYHAEEGMTWGEWIDSELNYLHEFLHYGITVNGHKVVDIYGNQINDDTILCNGDVYSIIINSSGYEE